MSTKFDEETTFSDQNFASQGQNTVGNTFVNAATQTGTPDPQGSPQGSKSPDVTDSGADEDSDSSGFAEQYLAYVKANFPRSRSPRSKFRRSRSPRSKSPRSRFPYSRVSRSRSPRSKFRRSKSPCSKSTRSKSPRSRASRSKSPRRGSSCSKSPRPRTPQPDKTMTAGPTTTADKDLTDLGWWIVHQVFSSEELETIRSRILRPVTRTDFLLSNVRGGDSEEILRALSLSSRLQTMARLLKDPSGPSDAMISLIEQYSVLVAGSWIPSTEEFVNRP
ncbi:hypothetical protein N7494_010121 [Penicillium frequentans]|uniref:Uncharacterized protein n=1 Tax=Penicillium frequentans TaxID=3151616 RepID=A0AAD6GE21_9EURO|nr:hypothetical protein N7494_010121 [Penicillium glabrum]